MELLLFCFGSCISDKLHSIISAGPLLPLTSPSQWQLHGSSSAPGSVLDRVILGCERAVGNFRVCCFGNVWLELKMGWEQLEMERGVSVQGNEEALSGKMGRVILHLHRGLHQCIQRL